MEEEQKQPMLEMAARVGAESRAARSGTPADEATDNIPLDDERAPTTPSGAAHGVVASGADAEAGELSDSGLSLLACEFAVGSGISSTWVEEHDDDVESRFCDCSDEAWASHRQGLLLAWSFVVTEGVDRESLEGDGPFLRLARGLANGVCRRLGARKLGHMSVLWSSPLPHEKVDGESLPGGARVLTRLRCVVGPFWPFTLFVTYPLIFVISGAVACTILPQHVLFIQLAWAACVVAMVVALSFTACSDPGVLRRHPERPVNNWRWNDQARTYRPPGAIYDEDLGLIVTGFDHVCPWTGTGIGEKNLHAFHVFVSLLCVCIIFDVLLVMKVLP